MHALNDSISSQSQLYFFQKVSADAANTSGGSDFLAKVKDLLTAFDHDLSKNKAELLQAGTRPALIRMEFSSQIPTRSALNSLRLCCQSESIDLVVMPKPRSLASYKLLAMDMDSTVISIECLDEVADFCGKKNEVASITEAAMRGEITDYAESLRRRVAFLRGLSSNALQAVLTERLRFNKGAKALVAAAKSAGLHCLLVSGGFQPFTGYVAQTLGFDEIHCNTLGIDNNQLTGEVIGPIVDGNAKREAVLQAAARLGIDAGQQAIAIGDGANDLAMMSQVHLSLAYRAKPVVADQASAQFNVADLDSLLDCLTT
jgi:phosphoserine phosphatase